MTIMDLIDLDLRQSFNEYIGLGITEHKQAITLAKRDVIEMYGLTSRYDSGLIEHLNAVALAY
ncbi:hypothetical protein EFN46_10835 [Leuconostoc pseudomesenteroides]|uniref:hypothetical protein n=1 Tax=Leuconostoc pseudomesenteroides TaxID=33968 RepID=UPI0021AA1DCC|nr:hypothetical protein [Leuconostoc pseudomesenteroides]MCT4388689.1 hypothetical protein [Leuconostoc pseudomesenteroides]